MANQNTSSTNEVSDISMTNTKKEMLQAYQQLKEILEARAQTELKPEKEQKAKKEKALIEAAEKSVESDVGNRIASLKDEVNRFLTNMAVKIEAENKRYEDVKAAIMVKDEELKEIYDIEQSAYTLAALLEAQKLKKSEFETEMTKRRHELESGIQETRYQWEKEKLAHTQQLKEVHTEEDKRRKREKEEFEYAFKREKEQKKQELNDELEKLNKSMSDQQETFDKEIAGREKAIQEREVAVAEREKYLDELQQKVDQFPEALKKQVDQAIAETTERLQNEAKKSELLLQKGFEGEKNVLQTKIDAFEKLVADQQKHIDTVSKQIDTAYGKVQEIAVKAVSGKGGDVMQPITRDHREHHESGYKG